jgi:Flp pilus assembly protein TadD
VEEPVVSAAMPAQLPAARQVTSRRWVPVAVVGVVIAAAGVAACVVLGSGAREKASTSVASGGSNKQPELRQPAAGLRALGVYRAPRGSEINTLDSIAYWENAQHDLEDAARQPGAPVDWKAGAEFARGQALARAGKLQDAVVSYQAAIAAAPQLALLHAGLAIVLVEQGDAEAAVKAAQQAQRLEPTWWVAVATEARVYVRSDRLDNAVQTYRRALQLAPKEPVLLSELALVYHVQHLDSEAERYAKEAIAADPDMVPAHLLLAERALEDDNAEVAVAEATRAVAGAPDHLSPRLALADALALAKKTDDARANYQRALDIWKGLETRLRGEHDARMKLVEEALARNKLPMSRKRDQARLEAGRSLANADEDRRATKGKLKDTAQRKQQKQTASPPNTQRRDDGRTAPCAAGDPLCGIQ